MSDEKSRQQTVRFANRNGGCCTLLGLLVDRTPHSFVYICPSAPDRRSHIPKRLVHLEPCASCPDHPRSRYPMTMEATPEQIVMFLMGTKQPTV